MSSIRGIAALLLALATQWMNDATGAESLPSAYREPEELEEKEEVRRARKSLEMETWLRRLAGRFRVEGLGTPVDVTEGTHVPAMADCVGVGSGPGVHCIVGWVMPEAQPQDTRAGAAEGRSPAGRPSQGQISRILSMYQFGFDPNASRIRIMRAESSGLVQEGSGVLSGDTMRFRSRCPDSRAHPPCESVIQIAISADGERISMKLYVTSGQVQYFPASHFEFYRVPQDAAAEAGAFLRIPEPPAGDGRIRTPPRGFGSGSVAPRSSRGRPH